MSLLSHNKDIFSKSYEHPIYLHYLFFTKKYSSRLSLHMIESSPITKFIYSSWIYFTFISNKPYLFFIYLVCSFCNNQFWTFPIYLDHGLITLIIFSNIIFVFPIILFCFLSVRLSFIWTFKWPFVQINSKKKPEVHPLNLYLYIC